MKKGYKRKDRDEEDDEDEDESDEEPPKKKAKKAAKPKAKAKAKPKPKPKAGKKKKQEESEDEDEDESEESDDEPPAKKKASASPPPSPRGGIVDREVPGRNKYTIYDEYHCKLNQTNIGQNNNKYYIIQVLTDGSKYWSWNRWGRVGEPGQNAMKAFPTAAGAIAAFKKKFKDKTVNNWEDRDNFVPRPQKYTLIETEEEEGTGGDDVPLGKLSKAQIEKGQAVLDQLEPLVDAKKQNRSAINELSSRYYTLIPHTFGRKVPPAIATKEMLNEQVELLKFYLRMGFQDMEIEEGVTPIDGLADLPLPKTLLDAAKNVCDSSEIGKCVFKGKSHEAAQTGKPTKKMTKENYGSIFLYTGNAIYSDLNKALREVNRAKIKSYMSYLRLFMESLNSLPQNKVNLWRGIGVDLYDQYKVGSTITWWSVSSCTADINVAKSFMNGCGGKRTLMTIRAKTACDISVLSFYQNEKESLLAPGTQLKVLKSKRNGDVAEIEVEEVGREIY
eukprot:TRINITY_DN67689_c12_g5_i1.p1 TRINITY_DN67689_c12_g5~~TRINITY_DN67689_c12_g5_i1.p1  ORF type:complete len:572 (-),score=151.96 TRINITY_DN67689_c12_g5_i1:109-1617(-)